MSDAASQLVPPGEWLPRRSYFEGSTVALIMDPRIQAADIYGGVNVLAPGHEIPLHYHDIGEFQFILSGTGIALGPVGSERPIGPHWTVFSPAGQAGAHGFRNTGSLPLQILFLYPSPGGEPPKVHLVKPHTA